MRAPQNNNKLRIAISIEEHTQLSSEEIEKYYLTNEGHISISQRTYHSKLILFSLNTYIINTIVSQYIEQFQSDEQFNNSRTLCGKSSN